MADDSAGAASASAASCPAASLVPSQAVNSRTSSSEGGDGGGPGRGGGGGGGGNRRRNRGRGGGGEKQPNRADGGATEAADGENETRGGGDGGDGGDAGREGRGNKRGRRNRGRGKRRGSQASAAEADAGSAAAAGAAAEDGDGKPPADGGRGRGSRTPPRRGRKKGGGRGGGRGGRDDETGGRGRGGRGGGRGRNRGGRRGGQDARFPWRALIPRGAVDPISLDPLNRLPYPPFALSATEPYEVISEWPVPEPGAAKGGKGGKETEEERQKRREREIMAEQWGATYAVSALNSDGDMITGSQNATEASAEGEAPATGDDGADEKKKPRYLHLYDGRVLAYYLVSQLQFIDPLNRRDLTRPELVNLDEYLRRHRLGKAGVAEAYDAQGVTISSAGAAGHTDEGRARRLQQEAEVLLRSLVADDGTARREGLEGGSGDFAEVGNGRGGRRGRHPPAVVQSGTPSHFQNDFERQYVESERRRDAKHGPRSQSQPSHQHQHQAQAPATAQPQEDAGIYHERGVLMIDDDMNPGLRAGLPAAAAAARRSSDPGGDYPPLGDSAAASGGIGFGYGDLSAYRHEERVRADAFPALQASIPKEDAKPPAVGSPGTGAGAGAGAKPAAQAAKPAAGKPSKSLLKIAGTITKTDPAEVERQKRAREEAQRRAALANQSFVPPGAQVYQQPIGMEVGGGPSRDPFAPPERAEAVGPSEGQLERNRNLASALGVAPSTVRAGGDQKPSFHSGWARPSVPRVAHDEFGNELFTAHYPDALIVLAREKMDVLLKLERRWKTFLEDDKAASHPLRPMPRESRRLVHEYAVYWNLKTESFDPEPKRYVHCVKLRDTAAPHPLLSRAARTWRGPGTGGPVLPPVSSGGAAAGVGPGVAGSRPQPCVSRIPHPPSNPNLQQAAGQSTLGGNASSGGAREFPHPTEGPRAPLQLQPRSVPAPPFQAAMGGAAAPPPGAMFDMDVAASALPPPPAGQASKSSNGDVAGAGGGRFAGLFEAEGRSRPKLELAPRTVPLELPPYDPSSGAPGGAPGYDPLAEAKSREAERARAARAREQKEKAKARILADAFASDDEGDGGDDDDEESDWEEEGGGGVLVGGGSGAKKGAAYADDGGDSDASSDWGEEGAVFAGEDEE